MNNIILKICFLFVIIYETQMTINIHINVVNLQIPKWNQSFFSEVGAPLVLQNMENLFKQETMTFFPKYSVLYKTVSKEASLYINVENVSHIFFHLFELVHPNGNNYKIPASENLFIEKCSDNNVCNQNLKCERKVTNIRISEKISNTFIFISWKYIGKTLYIVIQYLTNYIKCVDTDPFDVQKLVMAGEKTQQVNMKKQIFNTTRTSGSWDVDKYFDLDEDRYLYVQFLQCMTCSITFTLTCNNTQIDNIPMNGSVNNNVRSQVLEFGMMYGWTEIILPTKKHSRLNHCNLNIVTQFTHKSYVFTSGFWNIATIIANVKSSQEKDFLENDCYFHIDNNTWKWNLTFNLENDDQLYLKTRKCFNYRKKFFLKCKKLKETVIIETGVVNKTMVSRDPSNDWITLYFPDKPRGDLSDCSLFIGKAVDDNNDSCPQEQIWIIKKRFEVTTDAPTDTTTTKDYSMKSTVKKLDNSSGDSKSKDSIEKTNCNNIYTNNVILLVLIIIIIIIIILIVFTIYLKRRKNLYNLPEETHRL